MGGSDIKYDDRLLSKFGAKKMPFCLSEKRREVLKTGSA